MFCSKCGKEIPNDSRVCPYCSEPVETPANDSVGLPKVKLYASKLSTSTILLVAISAIVILSMLLLPMYDLEYQMDGETRYEYTVYFMGNTISSSGLQQEIGNLSLMMFVFIDAFVVTGVLCKIAEKNLLGTLFSSLSFGVLLYYRGSVNALWSDDSARNITTASGGYTLCMIGTVALMILFLVAYIKSKSDSSDHANSALNTYGGWYRNRYF